MNVLEVLLSLNCILFIYDIVLNHIIKKEMNSLHSDLDNHVKLHSDING